MSLSAIQLEAFIAVVQTGSFSLAAKKSHVTQSALSQRILNLEQELKTRLLIRDRRGVRLTPAGQELLRFCQIKNQLEDEFLSQFQMGKPSKQLSGVIRIGCYSSISTSLVLPALAPLLRTNSSLQLELATKEMRELPSLLDKAEVDFILLDYDLKRLDIESLEIAHEDYVLIRPTGANPPSIFLDHDVEDQITKRFIKNIAPRDTKIERRYLDDIYGIIQGVKLGLGQAVVSKHLIANEKGIAISRSERPMRMPIVLHSFRQPYSTLLHAAIVEHLSEGIPRELSKLLK
ncbi:MAG: LysR family transcriptional regulator [Bdellovibrionales bacterium]|nr:LysR family transcriptional regulator [Bdellovibrionales bacterium]